MTFMKKTSFAPQRRWFLESIEMEIFPKLQWKLLFQMKCASALSVTEGATRDPTDPKLCIMQNRTAPL